MSMFPLLAPYLCIAIQFANGDLQAGILSLEEEIIDATTEEGQKQLKEMERQTAEETKYDDPE